MRRGILAGLLLLSVFGCRYRFTPGIYVPMQVGIMYRYTSRLVINDRYEKPQGRYYTPDTLYIIGDTVYKGYDARRVYVKKQYACKEDLLCNPYDPHPDCYCTADTLIYYLKEDTLIIVSDPLNFLPPRFSVILDGRPHFVETNTEGGEKETPVFYTLANPGTSWKVAEGNATVRVYPEGYDTVPDSVDTYNIRFRIRATVEGFEDAQTSYRRFTFCARVRYDLFMGGELPDVTLHAMDMWWCDGVGQVKYVYTPEAATYKDSTFTYMELSFIEGR